jgi:murein L,D-transpeptidase YafK
MKKSAVVVLAVGALAGAILLVPKCSAGARIRGTVAGEVDRNHRATAFRGTVAGQADRNHRATAYRLKLPMWQARFKREGLKFPPEALFLRIFKKESELEVWSRQKPGAPFRLLKTYPIAASSGVLGPKRREGDGQVPEGFYRVQGLNPFSSYYLSIKVDYPNRSDRILGDQEQPGGDIFIHGKDVTIGCVPITDDGIRELYVLVEQVRKTSKSSIPVHFFPARFTTKGWTDLQRAYAGNAKLLRFWQDLKAGYDAFEKSKTPPVVKVGSDGRYSVR